MATINDVYNEINRIEIAKDEIENAIKERGVDIPDGTLLGEIPEKIRAIPGPVQADWSEDNPENPSYIKNKPKIPVVPEISTDLFADKDNNNKTTGAKEVYDAINPVIENEQPVTGMLPNEVYNFGVIQDSFVFLFAGIIDQHIVNHYYWIFDTGASAPAITWPSEITKWFGGSAPQISANKHYEISVINGIAVAMEV